MTTLYAIAVFITAGSLCHMWLSGVPLALPGVVAGIVAATYSLTELWPA